VKKAALVALRVLGVVVALLATSVAVSVLILKTDWGGERLRRQVVSSVNRQIQGSLGIKRLSFGGNRVVVWGVELRTPDGQLVAQVARAEVDFSLIRVLHKEIRVTELAVETPLLTLVSDDQGLNLSRATAPRKKAAPATPAPKTTQEGWVLRVDRFELTHGDITAVVAAGERRDPKVHLAGLGIFASVRYATGNGSLNLKLRLNGQSQLVPVGPLRFASRVDIHGETYRFEMDGDLLGGTLKAHGNIDGQHLGAADILVALAIPRQALAGHDWGPLRIDGQAHPGSDPKLDALLAIPGIQLTAKDRDRDFGVEGHLAMTNLGLSARAIHALTGADMPPIEGRGELDFGIGRPAAGVGASFGGHAQGAFETLQFGENVISRLTIKGQAEHLSSRPGSAELELSIASVNAGTTQLRGIALFVKVAEADVSAKLAVASPARVDLSLAGRLDDDQHGFALRNLALSVPGGRWTSEGTAHLRFGGGTLSLEKFRLVSDGQVLALDGSKRDQAIAAHLLVSGLRLGRLPTAMIDPALRLDGELDADIKADGQMDAPKVAAQLALRQARYQGFSKINAKLKATLEDQKVDGSVRVEAPFLTATAEFKLPTDPLAPGAPIDLRLDVKHLDLADVLRAAEMKAIGGGRMNLKLRLDGSADKPNLDLSLEAFDLAVIRPPKVTKGTKTIDLGHMHLHLTYAALAARAAIDFASSHGGTLVVDAGTHVDLSYPRVTRGLVVRKLPLAGKVVARNLDVAWIAQFGQRVESMGGEVSADARLGGTVGDPEFLGDVHWKNGEIVTTARPKAVVRAAVRKAEAHPASGR
jgi:hypothetical protein